MRTMMRTACAVLGALTIAGCAGNRGGPAGGEGGEFLQVRVENDGTIPSHVRVFLVRDGGAEALVGTMSTLGTETLSVTMPEIGGTYYLRAEGTGYALTSRRISLRGNETITWDMRQNILRRGGR